MVPGTQPLRPPRLALNIVQAYLFTQKSNKHFAKYNQIVEVEIGEEYVLAEQ